MRVFLHAVFLIFAATSFAQASSLRVSPILLDVAAPGATSTLTLLNDGDAQIHVQIRVFRWTGTKGEPVLAPTDDVVVSPPAATLAPGTDYVVRVVRVAKESAAEEESYRILVDEVADTTRGQASAIRFALRYSVPVFFSAAAVTPAKVAWSLQPSGNTGVLTASNSGGRRVRVANLRLTDAAGVIVLQRSGLFGYALGKSSTAWTLPAGTQVGRRGSIRLHADTETGAIDAVVAVQPPR
jgi:fimbrial chaperone protein